jgi:catechol 2,3-dioxygenase-like lactoylglutathione lyase family enzyme
MKVAGVLETCLYASDLAAAADFYERALGLDRTSSVEGRHVFFRCGAGMFLVFDPARTRVAEGEVPTHGATGSGHVAFAIDPADLPAWRRRLEDAGVAIEAEVTWPSGGRSLYLRDPAGNSVELTSPGIWGL